MASRMPYNADRLPQLRRRRGSRRNKPKIPCDDCIKRASDKASSHDNIELCEQCTATLRKPRRSQQGSPEIHDNAPQHHSRTPTNFEMLDTHSDSTTTPWSADTQEKHSLQFFIRHSAPQLAGYFDSPFWERMVLQAGQHQPAVRHAIAAVGALHEKLLMGTVDTFKSSTDATTRFALEQCNKSIRYLTQGDERAPDLRLMLTACVLFTCLEAIQGNCEQAIAHATQGQSLLQQYAAANPTNHDKAQSAFAVELDQPSWMMGQQQTQVSDVTGRNQNGFTTGFERAEIPAPKPFDTLHGARAGLELVLNEVTLFFLDLELNDQFYNLMVASTGRHSRFAPWLQAWEQALTDFLVRKHGTLSEMERKNAMVLKAHHIVAEILSNVDLSLGELGWDVFNHKFAAVVDLAEAALAPIEQSGTVSPHDQANMFSLGNGTELSFRLGITDPLCEVCCRCRDPITRRRALELLAQHPRQNVTRNSWSNWSNWKVDAYRMKVEEEAMGNMIPAVRSGDIAAENRVSDAWLDISQPTSSDGVHGDRTRVKHRFALPERGPRKALNPGLFATDAGGYSLGQLVGSAAYSSGVGGGGGGGGGGSSGTGDTMDSSVGQFKAYELALNGATFGSTEELDDMIAEWNS